MHGNMLQKTKNLFQIHNIKTKKYMQINTVIIIMTFNNHQTSKILYLTSKKDFALNKHELVKMNLEKNQTVKNECTKSKRSRPNDFCEMLGQHCDAIFSH